MKTIKKNTQFHALIEIFLLFEKLNKNDAMAGVGCTTLAQRVADMKEIGFRFKEPTWKTFTTRQGTQGRMIEYTLIVDKKTEKLLKDLKFWD